MGGGHAADESEKRETENEGGRGGGPNSLVGDVELGARFPDDRRDLRIKHVRHGREEVVLDLEVYPAHQLRHHKVAVAEVAAVPNLLARGVRGMVMVNNRAGQDMMEVGG